MMSKRKRKKRRGSVWGSSWSSDIIFKSDVRKAVRCFEPIISVEVASPIRSRIPHIGPIRSDTLARSSTISNTLYLGQSTRFGKECSQSAPAKKRAKHRSKQPRQMDHTTDQINPNDLFDNPMQIDDNSNDTLAELKGHMPLSTRYDDRFKDEWKRISSSSTCQYIGACGENHRWRSKWTLVSWCYRYRHPLDFDPFIYNITFHSFKTHLICQESLQTLIIIYWYWCKT